MKKVSLFSLSVLLGALGLPLYSTLGAVFDSHTVDPATTYNYWPWGDNRNTRYQLWFSQTSLVSSSGVLSTIKHFASGDLDNLGTSSYALSIYASTTTIGIAGLSAANPESNHGADKTLIFSGTLISAPTLLIDVADVFSYSNTGNLLIDYQFSAFSGVGSSYEGPAYQASYYLNGNGNTDFARVTNHSEQGGVVYVGGAIRTQLEFSPVPEPGSSLLMLAAAAALAAKRMRKVS